MKCMLLLLSLCQINFYCYSQFNLVPNYSFEDSVVCPSQPLFVSDSLPKPWYIPSNFQDGYYAHSCATWRNAGVPYNTTYGFMTFQYAKTGNGYASFDALNTPNYRSYLQVKMKDSLIINHCYYCEFWINLPNPNNKASNNIAMWLTKTAIYSDTIANPFGLAIIPANPQIMNYGNPIITDTMNWVKVSSVYIAQGGEQFITIGNFKDDTNTAIKVVNTGGTNNISYLVDDVSIIPLDSIPLKAEAGKDTIITTGDSVFIGSLTNGIANIKWYNVAGQAIDSVRPGFYVKPTINTFYVVEQTVCGYTSRDTVYITVQAMPVHLISFTGRQQAEKIKLQWTVENEQNFDRYEVERSLNGRSFYKAGLVKANNARQYLYTDNTPLTKNYYRLKLLDKDGKYNYSKVVTVELTDNNKFIIYPNPATNSIQLQFNKIITAKVNIEISDAAGKVVIRQNVSANGTAIMLSTSKLTAGIYIVKATAYGENNMQRLIINK